MAMPSPPRILLNNSVVLITARVEEGLPFVATQYLNLIIWSILARAQTLYDIKLCHLFLMGNHLHFILCVKDPESIVRFMERFKTESSHAINRLLGRRQRTVWCDGYDCVPMLTAEDVISKIAYLYLNPSKARLVNHIEEYPGVSSWEMFQSNKLEKISPWVRRTHITALTSHSLTLSQQRIVAQNILAKTDPEIVHKFTLTPDLWMDSFGITDPKTRSEINSHIFITVKEEEDRLKKQNPRVIGAQALTLQSISKPFTPKKFSPRMWCICKNKEVRINFIKWVKLLINKGREVSARWKCGDFSKPYPPGLFPPRFPVLCNLIDVRFS